ncbi:hypothetical protein MP638_004199 [Amoeboaphelidium occidentale]|nr:hypothetical protein MP638_004199 [Amoeboaphelidium occidentale]
MTLITLCLTSISMIWLWLATDGLSQTSDHGLKEDKTSSIPIPEFQPSYNCSSRNSVSYQIPPQFIELKPNSLYLIEAFVRENNEVWTLVAKGASQDLKSLKCGFCLLTETPKFDIKTECWSTPVVNSLSTSGDVHGKPLAAAFAVCNLGKTSIALEDVAFTLVDASHDDNVLKDDRVYHPDQFSILRSVKRTPNNPKRKPRITVCSGPHWGFERTTLEVWEWLEYQYLMGASKVRMYVSKDNTLAFINTLINFSKSKFYKDGISNFAEIVNWNNLPDKNMHYRSQLGLVNHCVFLSNKDSDYVMFNDVDEYVYPTSPASNNWFQLLRHFDEEPRLGAIRFKNWYYDKTCHLNGAILQTLGCNIRNQEPWTFGREKYMVKPDRVGFAGIHDIHIFLMDHNKNSYNTKDLSPSEVHLAHYTYYSATKDCNIQNDDEKQLFSGVNRFGKQINQTISNNDFFNHRNKELP